MSKMKKLAQVRNKTVLLPIVVPIGEMCWDGHDKICEYFDNEGGWPNCCKDIGGPTRDTEYGYLKPQECLALKEEVKE